MALIISCFLSTMFALLAERIPAAATFCYKADIKDDMSTFRSLSLVDDDESAQ